MTQAQALAWKLSLPFIKQGETDRGSRKPRPSDLDLALLLTVAPDGLRLMSTEQNGGVVYIDFIRGRSGYRQRRGGGWKQPLARAVQVTASHSPSIIDATAGFGSDAALFASLGADVTLIEKSSVLCALLNDAILRAQNNKQTEAMAARMRVVNADSCTWLSGGGVSPDVIYLDPMYPARRKSAKVGKHMQLLHILSGPATNTGQLLTNALAAASKRVVVKRPVSAEPIACEEGILPDFALHAVNTRFDIYQIS